MKVKWWASLAVALVLGGCTSETKPDTGPSAAPVVAQEEVVPAGYFRKPKDGEICKKGGSRAASGRAARDRPRSVRGVQGFFEV